MLTDEFLIRAIRFMIAADEDKFYTEGAREVEEEIGVLVQSVLKDCSCDLSFHSRFLT